MISTFNLFILIAENQKYDYYFVYNVRIDSILGENISFIVR